MVIETSDDQIIRAKNHQRSSVETTGGSRGSGQTFAGGSAGRNDGSGVSRSGTPSQSHGESVAGFAGRVGLLACRLHALSALGSPRRLAALVEESANRTLCPKPAVCS